MQKATVPAVTVLLLACSLSAQQAMPQKWKSYEYPADSFGIVAPFEPQIYPDPQMPDVRIYHWDLGSGIILTLRAGIRPDCIESLKRIKDAPLKDQPASVPGSLKDVSQNGMPGLESEWHHPSYWSVERIYCGGQEAYSLSLAYPVNQPRPKDTNRMFNSFRLLKVSSKH